MKVKGQYLAVNVDFIIINNKQQPWFCVEMS